MPGFSVAPALTTWRSVQRNSAVWTSLSSVFSGLATSRPTAFQTIGERGRPVGDGAAGHHSRQRAAPKATTTPALRRRMRRCHDRAALTMRRKTDGDGIACETYGTD